MRTLNVVFTDKEYKKLEKAKNSHKDGCNWHTFILSMLWKYNGGKNGTNK